MHGCTSFPRLVDALLLQASSLLVILQSWRLNTEVLLELDLQSVEGAAWRWNGAALL
jgi:hypothetical protein